MNVKKVVAGVALLAVGIVSWYYTIQLGLAVSQSSLTFNQFIQISGEIPIMDIVWAMLSGFVKGALDIVCPLFGIPLMIDGIHDRVW